MASVYEVVNLSTGEVENRILWDGVSEYPIEEGYVLILDNQEKPKE